MRTVYYLAYGSNLHPLRLRERCPSAALLGVVELPNRVVRFAKRGSDRSGKCTLMEESGLMAYGVLYEMHRSDKRALDRVEGLGHGYGERLLRVHCRGRTCQAMSYVAEHTHLDPSLMPYDWYKAMVVHGACCMGVPKAYVRRLSSVEAIKDPDDSRRAREFARLRRMGHLA
jgi:gamma-glutamylcyclotransferase